MITIEIENLHSSLFNFHIIENGQRVGTCLFNKLSDKCVRLERADGKLSKEINDEIAARARLLGYDNLLFFAAPGRKVTRLAVLHRKTPKEWCYCVPLSEFLP